MQGVLDFSTCQIDAQAEFVIMNAAECEPLMHKDKQILAVYSRECIEGMQMVVISSVLRRVFLVSRKNIPMFLRP